MLKKNTPGQYVPFQVLNTQAGGDNLPSNDESANITAYLTLWTNAGGITRSRSVMANSPSFMSGSIQGTHFIELTQAETVGDLYEIEYEHSDGRLIDASAGVLVDPANDVWTNSERTLTESPDVVTPTLERSPLPTVWTALTKPIPDIDTGANYFPYYPALLTRADGTVIDMQDVPGFENFPYRLMLAVSTDHATVDLPSVGIHLYYGNEPGRMKRHDEAVSDGDFAEYGNSMPPTNPVLDHTDIGGGIGQQQLETPALFLHPVTNELLLYAHAGVTGGTQETHVWRLEPADLTWTWLGPMYSRSDGTVIHTGYFRPVRVGEQMSGTSLAVGGDVTQSEAMVLDDVNNTGFNMEYARRITGRQRPLIAYEPERFLMSYACQHYHINGRWYALTSYRSNYLQGAGSNETLAETVTVPWRRESTTKLSDSFVQFEDAMRTMKGPAQVQNGEDQLGSITPFAFKFDGLWFMYDCPRNAADDDNNLILYRGEFAHKTSGLIRALQDIYSDAVVGFTGPNVDCTDGLNHGTINGTVARIESPIPFETEQAYSFDGNIANYVDCQQYGNLGQLDNRTHVWAFMVRSTNTAAQAVFGTREGASLPAYYCDISQNGTGYLRLFRHNGQNSYIIEVQEDTGVLDGNWHRIIISSTPVRAEARFWVDGVERTTTVGGNTDRDRHLNNGYPFPFHLGGRSEASANAIPFTGDIVAPIVIKQYLTDAEIKIIDEMMVKGVNDIPRDWIETSVFEYQQHYGDNSYESRRKTEKLTYDSNDNVNSNMAAVADNINAATKMSQSADAMILGAVNETNTPATINTFEFAETATRQDDGLAQRTIIFGNTALNRETPARIQSSTQPNAGYTQIVLKSDLPAIPNNGDSFTII